MGIVDPMIIGTAVDGVIQYGDGQMLALALLSVFGAAALGVGVSAWQHLRTALPGVPRPSGLRLQAAAAGAAAK